MSLGVSKTRAEVKDLQRLRQLFLEAPERQGLADYWEDESLLALYDTTYARRIGWKWSAVLNELAERRWQPPATIRRWIDWGCGSGIASEVLAEHQSFSHPAEITLSDRSVKAREFSARKISARTKGSIISKSSPENLIVHNTDLMLISHVVTELKSELFEDFLLRIASAGAIVWVEPGTPFCAEKLAQARAKLIEHFDLVAPCPHVLACPLQGSAKDWCHFFATPPSEIFQDSFWTQFAKEMNIDLRSLPVSFLVLQRKSQQIALETYSSGKKRLIARPRFYKGCAKVLLCRADGTADVEQLEQRKYKQEFKDWQKDCFYAEITNDQDSD